MVKYNKAIALFEGGSYKESYDMFSELGDYKDSTEYISKPQMSQSHDIGDTIKLGEYEWYITAKTDSSITLLCKDIVEQRSYNDKNIDITWEKCTLRKWLNEDFYNGFSEEEKALIAKTKCENKDNSKYGTKGGNDTEDYVFLLSLDEAQNVDESMRAAGSWWWLRSPGSGQSRAASVNYDGSLDPYGYGVDYEGGVRPALNLKF